MWQSGMRVERRRGWVWELGSGSVQRVVNRGALMTKIFEDAAALAKKPFHS